MALLYLTSNAQTNYLDNYINSSVTLTMIGDSSDLVNQPRDLDFKPYTNELWVCNYGDANGGTMIIFYNAGMPNQTSELRFDDHSSHFFRFPSSIAFSDIGQFANVSEIQNSHGSTSSTFMGPSLWLSDTSIYARVFQNSDPLGSHIDMLHQSPLAMGIAHDSAMAYWVMDGYNGNICKYDYVQHHGPGYDDHSAGKIWRYQDVFVERVPQIPSHLVLDKVNDWLYFIDGGSRRINRMNTNSGTDSGSMTPPSTAGETLSSYRRMLGAVVETVDSLATQPCGIDYHNDRLIVSDYTTGDIYLYNTSGPGVTIIDTIVTGHPGMMGVKVGPDGRIWCVNNIENKIYRLDVGPATLDASITGITSPLVENCISDYYSTAFNVCTGNITPTVDIANNGIDTIHNMAIYFTVDVGTTIIYNWSGSLAPGISTTVSLPSANISNGSHRLDVGISLVNGITDDITQNNMRTGSFRALAPIQALPFSEDFISGNFPPQNFNYVHFNPNNFMSRSNVSGFGIGNGSLKMNNFSGPMNISGQKDYLISPLLDFSTAASNSFLTFDVAYAKSNAIDSDELQIMASTDCGNTWVQLYDKAGTALATTTVTPSSFTPNSTQWRTDSVDLNSLAGENEVILMFTSISGYGNNVYLDNIFVGSLNVGVNENDLSASFNVFPNPATNSITIENNFIDYGKITVTDILGNEIYTRLISPETSKLSIDVSDWANGLYSISMQSGNSLVTKKINKTN